MADDNYAREEEGFEEEELDETVSSDITVILRDGDHDSHVIGMTELSVNQGCGPVCDRCQQLYAGASSLDRP